jgi:hypothetical protein
MYVMRDPIARVRSQYVAARVHGLETLPFEEAILERSVYTDLSRYAMQLDDWFRHFDPEQMMLITSEQLWREHEETMAEVFRFLGVDPDFVPEAVPRNVTKDKVIRTGVANEVRGSGFGRLMRHLPESMKAPVRRYADRSTHSASDIAAVVTPELRDILADVLRSDIERLKQYMPADFDAWGIC